MGYVGKGFLTGPAEMGLGEALHRRLKKGDVQHCDGVGRYKAYHSDIGRTIVVGQPSKRQVALHKLVLAAFARLDAVMKPGFRTSDIYRIIPETVAREGGDVNRLAIYCHSLGLDSFEFPHHQHEEGFVLEPNVCFCIYIAYWAPEDGGTFHVEDQFLVTDRGCQSFYTMSRDLVAVS